MAPRRLDHFPVVPGRSMYPWDELLDGSPWELVAGEDFASKPKTFIQNARLQARRRGGSVRTRLFENGSRASVVIQFTRTS